jgi:hypothetical protein
MKGYLAHKWIGYLMVIKQTGITICVQSVYGHVLVPQVYMDMFYSHVHMLYLPKRHISKCEKILIRCFAHIYPQYACKKILLVGYVKNKKGLMKSIILAPFFVLLHMTT